MDRSRLFVVIMSILLMGSWSAQAITPQRWIHTTEADFAQGVSEGVVVTNLGDIKLSTETQVLAELPDDVSIIFDMIAIDGETFVAAGPQANIMQFDGETLTSLYAESGHQVFALSEHDGKLLAGVSGPVSKLVVLDDAGNTETILELEEVRYIWDIVWADDTTMYLATGTKGLVLQVILNAEGEPTVTTVLETQQSNVLCLAMDSQGRLLAGTDDDGLVYRVAFGEGAPSISVLLDADQPEIGSIVIAEDDTIYVGTADANQAWPGRLDEANEEETGRPDVEGDADAAVDPEDATDAHDASAMTDVADSPDSLEAEPDHSEEQAVGDEVVEATIAEQTPTLEQYDRLREKVRERLAAAQETGKLQLQEEGGSGMVVRPQSFGSGGGFSGGSGGGEGNVVYRIDQDGFVTEVFRESVMILDLAFDGDGLLVATGSEGQLYRITPAQEENVVLADLEAQQITRLHHQADDSLLLATGNPGELIELGNTPQSQGTYTSQVLDAGQISLWGVLHLTAAIGPNNRIEVSSRSSNVQDPEHPAWSAWTEAETVTFENQPALIPREVPITAAPARYFQYRLTLHQDQDEDQPASELRVDRVSMAYVVPNLRPKISAFTAEQDDPSMNDNATPPTSINLNWEASDANTDRMLFTLHYKPAAAERWILIEDDIESNRFQWNTRQVPDGWYTLKVSASDKPSNPPDMILTSSRVSDPVLVDHTPPAVKIKAEVDAEKQTVTLAGTVEDELSPIFGLAYIVNDEKHYTQILPSDLILDSTKEKVSVTLRGLDQGPSVVTIRAYDLSGNVAYLALPITMD